jgi:hypothetical protein
MSQFKKVPQKSSFRSFEDEDRYEVQSHHIPVML